MRRLLCCLRETKRLQSVVLHAYALAAHAGCVLVVVEERYFQGSALLHAGRPPLLRIQTFPFVDTMRWRMQPSMRIDGICHRIDDPIQRSMKRHPEIHEWFVS